MFPSDEQPRLDKIKNASLWRQAFIMTHQNNKQQKRNQTKEGTIQRVSLEEFAFRHLPRICPSLSHVWALGSALMQKIFRKVLSTQLTAPIAQRPKIVTHQFSTRVARCIFDRATHKNQSMLRYLKRNSVVSTSTYQKSFISKYHVCSIDREEPRNVFRWPSR